VAAGLVSKSASAVRRLDASWRERRRGPAFPSNRRADARDKVSPFSPVASFSSFSSFWSLATLASILILVGSSVVWVAQPRV
jgi:hypothetical protein